MSNLNEQINSTFQSLIDFKPNDFVSGFGCTKRLLNGFEISIQCGIHNYCTPRENLNSPTEYSTFEVAVFNANGDWVTSKFFEDCDGDQVKGWASKCDILMAMILIQEAGFSVNTKGHSSIPMKCSNSFWGGEIK